MWPMPCETHREGSEFPLSYSGISEYFAKLFCRVSELWGPRLTTAVWAFREVLQPGAQSNSTASKQPRQRGAEAAAA